MTSPHLARTVRGLKLSVVIRIMAAMTTSTRRNEAHLRQNSRDGVLRVSTLAELGVPECTSYRRCQPEGPWTLLLPGIILLSKSPPTSDQRVQAALLHSRGHGLITGLEAVHRHGLSVPFTSDVHILISKDHQIRSTGYVHVERTTRLPPPKIVAGVPLAPPVRAVLDAARRLRRLDPVMALLIDAVRSDQCGHEALTTELAQGSRRGTALVNRVLNILAADLRSVPEAKAAALWHKAGLPPALHNPTLVDRQGEFIGMPDLWSREVALAWEIDSFEHHYTRDDYRRTLARNARYAANGVVVLQTLPSRLSTEAESVISELRAAYQTAQQRPCPEILIRTP